MLGVVVLFSQVSLIEIIVFNKLFLYLIEYIDFLSSNLRRYFTTNYFLWGFEDCQISHVLD